MTNRVLVRKMTRYMAWADDTMLRNAARLPPAELTARRNTLFGSIAGTFDHILLIGEIFRAHLESRSHTHTTRHRPKERPFDIIAQELRAMNKYYGALADKWAGEADGKALDETVRFTFVGGGDGAMTRAEILLHLVNHATYHRGFVSTLMYPFQVGGQANDLTVFLRDVWPDLVRADPSLAP